MRIRKKFSKSKWAAIMSTTVLLLSGSGVGIYFLARNPAGTSNLNPSASIRTSNTPTENNTNENGNTNETDSNMNPNAGEDNKNPIISSPQTSVILGKELPSIRDSYSVNCETHTVSLENINCFIEDKEGEVSNNIPYFNFYNIGSLLLNLNNRNDKGLKISSKKDAFISNNKVEIKLKESNSASGEDFKYYYLDVNDDMRKEMLRSAKLLTEKLLNGLSFNSEMVLLDKIIIREIIESVGFYSSLTNPFDKINARQISIGVDRIYYGLANEIALSNTRIGTIDLGNISQAINYTTPNRNIEETTNKISDNSPLKSLNLALDVDYLVAVFNHEYGHHQSLYNFEIQNNANVDDLLLELEKVFDFKPSQDTDLNDRNKRFEDFKELVKYFSNSDSTILSFSYDILQKIRSYQNKNVISIQEIFAEGLEKSFLSGMKSSTEIREKEFVLNVFLNNSQIKEVNNTIGDIVIKNTDVEKSTFIPFIGNEEKYKKVRELFKETFWYKHNITDYIKTKDNKALARPLGKNNYYLVPRYKSNALISEAKKSFQKTQGELFNASKVNVSPSKTSLSEELQKQVTNLTCEDAPSFFRGNSGPEEYQYLLRRYQLKNGKLETVRKTEVELANTQLAWYAYFLKKEEILTRMLTILSTSYEDKRNWLLGCDVDLKVDNGKITMLNEKFNNSDQTLISDYGFFKSFGMDLFALTKDKRIQLQNWLQRTERITTLNANQGFFQTTKGNDSKTYPFFYSYKSRRLSTREQVYVYSLLNLRLNNDTDKFKVLIQYKNSVKKPLFYDFNNRFIVKPSEGDQKNFGNFLKKETIVKESEAKNYISLAFPLQKFDSSSRLTPADIETNFSLDNIRVFIDTNQNGIFDSTVDTKIEII